jgi:hypothetical protein
MFGPKLWAVIEVAEQVDERPRGFDGLIKIVFTGFHDLVADGITDESQLVILRVPDASALRAVACRVSGAGIYDLRRCRVRPSDLADDQMSIALRA